VIGDFRLALSFLTRIPVPLADAPRPNGLAHSMRLFPLVGALIGAMVGGIDLLAAKILPPWPSALLAVAFGLLLTGALHEDGLADCADGFGGGRDKEAKLAIMRDSRVGTYGALALILSVALRAAAIAQCANPAGALIAAHALSRALLPGLMRVLPPASATGLAASAGTPARADFLIALLIAVILSVPLLGIWMIPVLGMTALAFGAMTALARRQIGGYSGDVLGALQQTCEILILLVILAHP
jgi:adenosylcobinamide-GDP ribazoletransferase